MARFLNRSLSAGLSPLSPGRPRLIPLSPLIYLAMVCLRSLNYRSMVCLRYADLQLETAIGMVPTSLVIVKYMGLGGFMVSWGACALVCSPSRKLQA